jgi:hypothetical protein
MLEAPPRGLLAGYYVVDMSAQPLEIVARHVERLWFSNWPPLQVYHDDLWHDGRWEE